MATPHIDALAAGLPPPPPVDGLAQRIRAALVGALAGEQAVGGPTGAAQLLSVAESLALLDGLNLDDLRSRGLSAPPSPHRSAVLLRAIPWGLLASGERALIRRGAYRTAHLAGVDEATAITTVAVGVLCADLMRHDLPTSLIRVHQTLLEEAPLAVLDRLRPLPPEAPWVGDEDPLVALQIAITVLGRATGVRAVIDELRNRGPDLTVAVSLAAALAGARDRDRGLHDAWYEGLPNWGRASTASSGLSKKATARLGPPPEAHSAD